MENTREIQQKLDDICSKIEIELSLETTHLNKQMNPSEIKSESEHLNEINEKSDNFAQESSTNQESCNENEKVVAKDPAYIPRKGYYYEHDDRYGDDEEMEKARQKNRMNKLTKKKIDGKWTHDLFEKSNQNERPISKKSGVSERDNNNNNNNNNNNKSIGRNESQILKGSHRDNKNRITNRKSHSNTIETCQSQEQKLKISDYAVAKTDQQRTKSSTIESNRHTQIQNTNKSQSARFNEENNYYFDMNHAQTKSSFHNEKNSSYWQQYKQQDYKSMNDFKPYHSVNENIKKSTSFSMQPTQQPTTQVFHLQQQKPQEFEEKPKRYSSMRNQTKQQQQQPQAQNQIPPWLQPQLQPHQGRPIIGSQQFATTTTAAPTVSQIAIPAHLLITQQAPPPGLSIPQLHVAQQSAAAAVAAATAAYYNFIPNQHQLIHQNQIYFNAPHKN